MPIAATYDGNTLLALVAAGDRTAFLQLYNTHLQNVYRYIFLFTKSKQETEEILQEVFIKIWENREKLAEVDCFQSYLFRAAKNKLLDNIRHLQIRHRVLSEIKRSKDIAVSATSDYCAYREYYQLVQFAIEKLPPKRKVIFRLNIENGLSQDEIARQLNISKSVVQKQTYKASQFVRDYLVKQGVIAYSILIALLLSIR